MSNNKPEVKLISKPNNLLKTIYTACRTCYSADTPINIYDTADDEERASGPCHPPPVSVPPRGS